MKSETIQPRVYESIQPGLILCPVCHSGNTAFVNPWVCFNCGELFERGQAWIKPQNPTRIGIVPYRISESGNYWYLSSDGIPLYISKEDIKKNEDRHIRPGFYLPPDYAIWHYNWIKTCEEIKARTYFDSLSQEQLNALKEQLQSNE